MKEKILILALGTGNIWKKEEKEKIEKVSKEEQNRIIEQKIKNKDFCYRLATYKIEEIEMETAFVAEPLIKKFKPNRVFILGTIKSAWTSFYTRFAKKISIDTFIRLNQIEKENGQKTCGEKLKCLEGEINDIYRKEIILNSEQPEIEVIVIITRYGLNQEELLDNYKKISQTIESILEKDKTYEVAFDITHSFRSLPLYNLVILNYFRHIKQYKITISHIYYGNVEVCQEMNNKAYIVDLKDLIEVLDLTSGINEFKNTGNAVTLLSLISNERLKNALTTFDWAMQINALNVIESAIKQVLSATENPEKNTDLRYAHLEEMIQITIKEKFFNGDQDAISRIEKNEEDIAELQYIISKWYLQQNRYGQAIITAMEALRSYLVKMYIRLKDLEENDENYKNENNRRASVERLSMIAKKLDKQDGMEKELYELEEIRKKAKNIRNEFAHNLEEGKRENVIKEPELSSKEIVEQFISNLGILRNNLQKNEDEVYNAYAKKYITENTKDRIMADNVRLVVTSNKEKSNFGNYRCSKNKKYNVYKLPDRITELFAEGKNNVKNAVLLWKYIDIYFGEKVNVILSEVSLKQMLHFAMILQNSKIQMYTDILGQLQSVPKLEYDIDYDFKKNYDSISTNIEQYLDMKPSLVGNRLK